LEIIATKKLKPFWLIFFALSNTMSEINERIINSHEIAVIKKHYLTCAIIE